MPNTFFNKKKPQKLRCRDEKNGILVKEVPLQGKIVCKDKKNIVDAEIVTEFFLPLLHRAQAYAIVCRFRHENTPNSLTPNTFSSFTVLHIILLWHRKLPLFRKSLYIFHFKIQISKMVNKSLMEVFLVVFKLK